MGDFGELVLAIGDFHIPQRAAELPSKFKDLLKPNKIQHILCTGNLTTKETLEYLKTVTSNVKVVQGDSDEDYSLPSEVLVTIGSVKFGLVSSSPHLEADKEALVAIQRRLGCDVLITGGTQEFKAFEEDGKFYVNPGSATGIFYSTVSSMGTIKVAPSFALLSVKDNTIKLYNYQLTGENDEVKVERIDFTKN